MFRVISVLAFVGSASGLLGDTCSDQSSCESCYESSFLCHWCKDIPGESGGSCHAKLSQYGCAVGDSCSADDCADRNTCSACKLGGCKWCASAQKCVSPYSWVCALPSNCLPNSECERTAPEFIGYERAVPDWIIYLFTLFYSLVVGTSVFVWRRYKHALAINAGPWLYRLVVAGWTLAVLGMGIGFTGICLFWPSPPEVSMCNAELMWSDTLNMIINSITSGKASVDSEVLITVYNPNRFGLTLNSVNGNIFYKGGQVGTLELAPIDAQAGSAADALGVITFNGFDRIAAMYYDFNVKHKLELDFELFLNFSIGSFGGFSVGAPKLRMNVNDPPPQKHCNCLDNPRGDEPYDFDYM